MIDIVDIFSNSSILKQILKFIRAIIFFCSKKTAKIISSVLFLFILAYIGWTYSWIYSLIVIFSIILFILIWKRPEFGVILLIFSFALTPKIHVGTVNSVIVPIRIDDLLLVIIALVILAKIALKRIELKPTSLDIPIFLFLNVVMLSTFRAFFIHTTNKPIINLLYVSKIIEYFLIFYLTIYNIREEKKIKLCLWSLVISCVIVSLIGIWEHFHPLEIITPPNYYRLYERGLFHSESNHFGGYFVFLIGIAGGYTIFSSNLKNRVYWALFSLLAFFPLLWTYSRQSYLALLGPIIVFLLFKKNKRYFIGTVCIMAILFAVLLSTQPLVRDRLFEIKNAFLSKDPYQSSFAFRLINWKEGLSSLMQYPVLGIGLGSRHRAFYESNQILILSELGIFGYVLFWFILLMILQRGIYLFNNAKSNFIRALTAGFVAGFIGLILHSFACNTFMITRIAGPFWIVAGLVFSQEKRNVVY